MINVFGNNYARMQIPKEGDLFHENAQFLFSVDIYRDGELVGWCETRAIGFESVAKWRASGSPNRYNP
jgi:L-arabinose isomerase